jgi:hypothetical protein
MPNDTYVPRGSHPEACIPKTLRKAIADGSVATEIIPAGIGIAVVNDWQIGTSADTTITVREKVSGTVLLKQQITAGSTPMIGFQSIAEGQAVEIVATGTPALQVDGFYRRG